MNSRRAVKRKEDSLRRSLKQMGYLMSKSRTRNPQAPGFSGYMILDLGTNCVVMGASPFSFSLTLDDVESFIRD
jgi:hypothetical protein